MIRSKTVALACASGLLSSAAQGAVDFTVGTTKAFRQLQANGEDPQFRGGTLSVDLFDGDTVFSGCESDFYVPVGTPGCTTGTTGYISFGNLAQFEDLDTSGGPYYNITGIVPAVIIEPSHPELAYLRAAPASTLPRPLYNFKDGSVGVYYNLHTSDVSEYKISVYRSKRTYRTGKSQRALFDSDLPPGVYHYNFPRLNQPNLYGNIASTLYPFTDGYNEKNNQKTGFRFLANGLTQNANGFFELNYYLPNTVKWDGLRTAEVIPASDKLYFSLLYTTSRKNPKSAVTYVNPLTGISPSAIYPTYVNEDETSQTPPNILLKNSLVSEFTLPPVIATGDTGVIRLELVRNLQTGGVTYDSSRRTFELPVTVVNKYVDYADLRFRTGTGEVGIVKDYDGDGYNNLTEWILGSLADDPQDIPDEPVAIRRPSETIAGMVFPAYYGFSVMKKRGVQPAVKYRLQRSEDDGVTWVPQTSDANWIVYQDGYQIRLVGRNGTNMPAGTANHRFRVKITRR